MIHDAVEHRWQRRWNAFRLRRLRDMHEDPRITRERYANLQRSMLRVFMASAARSTIGPTRPSEA
jgi:hypothetical protein